MKRFTLIEEDHRGQFAVVLRMDNFTIEEKLGPYKRRATAEMNAKRLHANRGLDPIDHFKRTRDGELAAKPGGGHLF